MKEQYLKKDVVDFFDFLCFKAFIKGTKNFSILERYAEACLECQTTKDNNSIISQD